MGRVTVPSDVDAPLSMQLASRLAKDIQSGVYIVGSVLPSESDLARDLGVSRPSVREALSALQFAGYVKSRQGYGSVVLSRRPSWGEVRDVRAAASWVEVVDLLEARVVLEPALAALAAADPDPPALDAAHDLIRGMRVAVSEPGLTDYTDHRVHAALAAICRNAVLIGQVNDLLKRASGRQWREGQRAAWEDHSVLQGWCDDHLSVIDAIAAGDQERAAAASRKHLISAAHNVLGVADLPLSLRQRLRRLIAP